MARRRGITGVYLIVNLANGKVYVGSASDSLPGRRKDHFDSLRANRHANRHIQRAWDKYGSKRFVFRILEYCPPEQCIEREQYWLDHYDSANPEKGYNIRKVASSNLGIKHSEESRARHSARAKKQFSSQESRRKASEAAKRRFSNPEERKRISESLTGRKFDEDRKARMSVTMNKRYSDPEERRKQSERSKRQWNDPVTRAKMLKATRIKFNSSTSKGD